MNHMRYIALLIGILLSFCLSNTVCSADEEVPEKDLPAFTKKLAGLSYISDSKPDKKARVFFVLNVMNTMGCRELFPDVSEVWHLLRGMGVDVVIVGRDTKAEKIKQFVEENCVLPPVVSPDCRNSIPFTYDGKKTVCEFPYLEVFSADGTKLGQDKGFCLSSIENWRKYVQPTQEEELVGGIRVLSEDMFGCRRLELTKKYTDANYIGSARPHKSALVFYRMFIKTAQCNPFVTSQPVRDIYKKMKGRGAEIILVSNGGAENDVLELIKKYKIPYPVIHVPSEKSASFLDPRRLVTKVDFGESDQRMTRELALPMVQLEHWEKFVKQLREDRKRVKQLNKKLKEYRKKRNADKLKSDKA